MLLLNMQHNKGDVIPFVTCIIYEEGSIKFLTINGKLQRDSAGKLITVPDNYDNSAITLNGKLLKTGGGFIGSNIIKPQLSVSSISLVSGTTIQIDSIDNNATTIAVYADNTKIGEVAKEAPAPVTKYSVTILNGSGSGAISAVYDGSRSSGFLLGNSAGTYQISSGHIYYEYSGSIFDISVSGGVAKDGTSANVGAGTYQNVVSINSITYTDDRNTGYTLRDVNGVDKTIPYTLTSDTTLEIYSVECLIEGTRIALSDGYSKAIEDIDYSDNLLVWNFYEGKFDSAKPVWIREVETAPKYNLVKFSNGSELGVAGPGKDIGYHRIFNKKQGAFTHTGVVDTPNGTTTFAQDGSYPTIVSQEVVEKPVKFYNVITDKHYNLFANSILTSCRLSNLYRIEDMKYVGERLITDEQIEKYFDKIKHIKLK